MDNNLNNELNNNENKNLNQDQCQNQNLTQDQYQNQNFTQDQYQSQNLNQDQCQNQNLTQDQYQNQNYNTGTINYNNASGSKEYIYQQPQNDYTNNDINNNANSGMNNNSNNTTNNTDNSASNNASYNAPPSDDKKTVKVKKKSNAGKFAAAIAIALVISLVSGTAGGFIASNYYRNNTTSVGNDKSNAQNVNIDLNDNIYFAAAVNEKNKDSVVGITTTTLTISKSFWGDQQYESQSIGSGVIVDSNGLIITNSHVIGDGHAKQIVVSLTDGTNEEGKVLWYDAALDLAIVKIERSNLTTAQLGDSDELIVGEPVVAIGNPMSLELNGTLTQGVISGLNRSITVENQVIKPLIQTDASINPGNSGGPLFNAKGEVIGINTAKMNTAEGLGFSIPINIITPILQQVADDGNVSAVYIGITGTSVAEYESKLGIDLSAKSGTIVIEILKDGPAAKAGLESGDIIVAIDDKEIEDMNDLKRALYSYKTGDTADITFIRNGEENTAELKFEARPDDLENR